jgi:tetratricopeptide (TPR) repeat protein
VFRVFQRLEALPLIALELESAAKICLHVGAFQEVLVIKTAMSDPLAKAQLPPEHQISLALSAAKAHRNLGSFGDSLTLYREAMVIAEEYGRELDRSLTLLLIGKLYGNYRGQRSLFSSFVEESRLRFRSLMDQEIHASDSERLLKYSAICEDALGQAYRFSDADRAADHFREAIRINERLGRGSGLIRSRCHLSFFLFQRATTKDHQAALCDDFELALRRLQSESWEERGLGIRWLQFAEMLYSLGRTLEAKEALQLSQSIALKYSDHRSLVRAAALEARMVSADLEASIELTERALVIAKKYNLVLHECELNSLLVELLARNGHGSERAPDLLERNKLILSALLSEVKDTLRIITLDTHPYPEFRGLSESTNKGFRERLVLDYENVVKKLGSSVDVLAAALRSVEARKQELLVLGVVNSMARELLHDLKLSLPDEVVDDPLKELASGIAAVAGRFTAHICQPSRLDSVILDREVRSLDDYAGQIEDLGLSMVHLKALLAAKLRRPRSLNAWVSLKLACEQAICDAMLISKAPVGRIQPLFEIDVQVLSDFVLMTNVIQQLLSNALQAAHLMGSVQGLVRISLKARAVGDATVGNRAKSGVLRVSTDFHSVLVAAAAQANIEMALKNIASDQPVFGYGSGFGLDFASTVFEGLMGASIRPFRDTSTAGLEVEFSPSNGKAQLVTIAVGA